MPTPEPITVAGGLSLYPRLPAWVIYPPWGWGGGMETASSTSGPEVGAESFPKGKLVSDKGRRFFSELGFAKPASCHWFAAEGSVIFPTFMFSDPERTPLVEF